MLIAQITDVHLGFDRGNPRENNRLRLEETLRALTAMSPRPDLLLVTGDLVEYADDAAGYASVRDILAALPFPAFPALGNHDGRAAFAAAFPQVATTDGFVQYAIEDWPLRILVLDTLEEKRHGGSFCEARAAWLGERLAEAPDRPTLIALHHPPIESGLSWMTEDPDAAWVRRLERVVSAHRNVVAMVGGHLHRPIVTPWAGTAMIVCAATAPQVALDLAPIDPERPDARPMIVSEPPAYALHLWNGRHLRTHFATAADHAVLARFGPELQPLVRMLAAEKG
ncbi:MAG: metallophosphoesterase [Allosphingosinicella sp.]